MTYDQILVDMKTLHDKKGSDYDHKGLYSNIRGSEDWGVKPWIGAMVRANDKIRRLQKFAQIGHLENESVRDSFLDLANYVIIGLILYDQETNESKVYGRTGV